MDFFFFINQMNHENSYMFLSSVFERRVLPEWFEECHAPKNSVIIGQGEDH